MDYSKYCYVWESYSDTGTVGCLPIHYPICAVKKTISNLRVLNFRNVYLTNMLLLGYSYTRNKSCNKSAKYFYIALFPFIFVYIPKGFPKHICTYASGFDQIIFIALWKFITCLKILSNYSLYFSHQMKSNIE